ncbi:hypothetical protein GCM10009765_10180 [Fodinicola feengrottensis]|uniref:ArsR family transcriptional regulator n=1 Tax=Fodinicola feengrottensis TaxID=435914 RepID=A0ABN2FZG4_9ACTN
MTGAIASRDRRTTGTSLEVGGTTAVQLSINPLVSLFSTLADSIGGPTQGTPPAVRTAVRAAVSRPSLLQPLFASETVAVPDCLLPFGRPGRVALADQLAELRSLRPEVLVEEIETMFSGNPPLCWAPVLAHPARWLVGYADALEEIWTATEQLWSRAQNLLALEAERVGMAVVTASVDVLLGSLSSRYSYADGMLTLPDRYPMTATLGDRPLVLAPLFSGIGASAFNLDMAELVWVGYPVPGIGSIWERETPTTGADDPLSVLVGTVRATLLRGLSRPMSMSDAATLASCSATTMTHHCHYLERAGLIERRRRQRSIMIHRSPRGDGLVDIFAG